MTLDHPMHASLQVGLADVTDGPAGTALTTISNLREVGRPVAGLERELRDIALVTFSCLIAEGYALKPQSYCQCRAIARYLAAWRASDEGIPNRAFESVPLEPWPDSGAALRRLGTTQRDLHDELERRRDVHGRLAHLDAQVLREFFPEPLWSGLYLIALHGPAKARDFAERAIRTFARRTVPATKRRPAGPLLVGTVEAFRQAYARIFAVLSDLNHSSPDSAVLAPWVAAPKVTKPQLPDDRLNGDAPPFEDVRLCFQGLNREIRQSLDAETLQDELAAIQALSYTRLLSNDPLDRVRDRLTLVIALMTGCRVGVFDRLCVGHFLEDYCGRAPDRLVGPALVLNVGKGKHPDKRLVVMIPNDVALMIRGYLCLLARTAEARSRRHKTTPPERSAETPLIVLSSRRWSSWGSTNARRRLSGKQPAPEANDPGHLPLIPRRAGFNTDLPKETWCYVGYNPHCYRRLSDQLAERAAELWNERHPATGGHTSWAPSAYAAALLAHDMKENAMRALYGDRDSQSTREILASRAAFGIWELLSSDTGARKQPDFDRYRESRQLLTTLERESASIERQIDQIGHAVKSGTKAPARATFDLLELQEHTRRVTNHQRQCERELYALRYDPSTWVAIPDDAIITRPVAFDFDVEIAASERVDAPPDPVRYWLTVAELAYVAGCDVSTVTRWLDGSHLPASPDRRPWEADRIPVDSSLGVRFRRVSVEHIKPSFWATRAMRERRDALLATYPSVQGWRVRGEPGPRCFAPLVLPAVFRSEATG